MNTLQFRYAFHDDQLTLRPLCDGHDVLADHRNNVGLDPDRLLPPLSSALLPTTVGDVVAIGACSCGYTECGSLFVRIARIGSAVLWGPAADAPHETVQHTYRFDLQPYLDAVDDAATNLPPEEGRGRRASRAVRLSFRGSSFASDSVAAFRRCTIDWVAAGRWDSDTVRASITTDGQQDIQEFAAAHGETDADYAARVAGQVQQTLLRRGVDGR